MQRSVWQHRLPLEAILDALVLAITRETNTHTWKAQRTKASNMADEPENMLAIVITPSMRKTQNQSWKLPKLKLGPSELRFQQTYSQTDRLGITNPTTPESHTIGNIANSQAKF
ncbi:hypothetical protein M5K25_013725 [Dendrobium thyrsiflorum]|uniref:Uncharacterized protein n=1 Tax=Dendrobium thyrsiflorum TaxID=117978 RepID=A0ABD0UTT2_DENTH